MTISAGTFTVGGIGTDYPGVSGLNDCFADMDYALTGNLTIDTCGNPVNWAGIFTKNFGSHTLKITSSVRHDGNPNIGTIITLTSNVVIRPGHLTTSIVSGSFILEYVQLRNYTLYPTEDDDTGSASKLAVTIHHCLFVGCAIVAAHFAGTWLYYCNVLTSFYSWHVNNVGNVIFENNTVYYNGNIGTIGLRPWISYCEYDNFVFRNNCSNFSMSGWPLPANEHMPLAYNNVSGNDSATEMDWRIGSSGNKGSLVLTNAISPINMTSNALPVPYVASASSEFSSSYVAYKAFDGDSATRWAAAVNIGWLQIDLGAELTFSAYSIQCCQYVGTAPKTWTLQGSNDGLSWSVIDTVASSIGWSTYETRIFNLSNLVTYRYIKLDITAYVSMASASISTFKLITLTEFISMASTNDKYLFLADNAVGVLATSGTAPTYATTDIAGLAIPYVDNYPIGCHVSVVEAEKEFPEMIIDSGMVYKDYGLETETIIGATRGGNKFWIEQEIEDSGYDGRGANVLGAKKIVRVQPFIETNIIEISADLINSALPASEIASGTSYNTITRALQISLSDYCDNITIVGEIHGNERPIICMIKNALCVSNFSMENNDRDETKLTLKFGGHFAADNLNEEPWEIRYPVGA